MKFEFAFATNQGRRPSNEDACCARPNLGLYAVADGMGGYEGGEIASLLTIETLVTFWTRVMRGDNVCLPIRVDYTLAPEENVTAAGIRLADTRIKAARQGALAHMGSTVAMLHAANDEVVVGHVGDSRVYRLRGKTFEQLTRDHSLYEELRATGHDVPPRERFPHGHVITRALGLEADTNLPDVRTEPVTPGDTFLLCTDGLTDVVDDKKIARLLAGDDLSAACDRLVDAAYENGSRDNITVVTVRAIRADRVSRGAS